MLKITDSESNLIAGIVAVVPGIVELCRRYFEEIKTLFKKRQIAGHCDLLFSLEESVIYCFCEMFGVQIGVVRLKRTHEDFIVEVSVKNA